MIPHTKSFKRLKDEAQTIFDFAIMICYAVPNLKATFKGLQEGEPLPFDPDYFNSRPIPTEKVRHHTTEYKEVLSRHIFLSSFSYFEAYFVDFLKEVIDFHGPQNLLHRHDITRNTALPQKEIKEAKRKLQEYRRKQDDGKYVNYGKKLAAHGFLFPSSILARKGLEELVGLTTKDDIKAAHIPDLVESLFQLPLEPKEKETFHAYRDMRNKIAHGRPDKTSLHLAKAVEANNFLRDLALKIDKHVLDHLMLVEI